MAKISEQVMASSMEAWKLWFEGKGWRFSSGFNGVVKMEKGDVWKDNGQGAFLEYNAFDGKIKITTTDEGFTSDGPRTSVKYHGKCNGEPDYDMICRLLDQKLITNV